MEHKESKVNQARIAKPSSFQFVIFEDLEGMRNAYNLSRIRKHAMRDIGVARRRTSNAKRRKCVKIPLEVLTELDITVPSPVATGFGDGAVDPFLRFPVDLDDFGRELVVNIFRESPRALRDDWFTVCIACEHTFYQLLSNEAIHVNKLRMQDEYSNETKRATRYHQDALVGIQTDLQQPIVTDGVLGTVAGFLIYAYALANVEFIEAHRSGLLSALSAYGGGLDALETNSPLRSTISWGDLRSAYFQDQPCKLPLPQTWADEAELLFEKSYRTQDVHAIAGLLQSHDIRLGLQPTLLDILEIVFTCSQHTKGEILDSGNGIDRLKLPSWVNVAIYTLLCFRPISITSEHDANKNEVLAESSRLALLMYLAPIWRFYGAHPVHSEVLVRKQYELLKHQNQTTRQDETWLKLQLWTLCMAAFEAERLPNRVISMWFVNTIANLTNAETDLLLILQEVLWVPLLFDQQLDRLQQQIRLRHRGHQEQGMV